MYTIDNSIFLQMTGISSISLKNEVPSLRLSGSQTGNNDYVERILTNSGVSIVNPVDFSRFLLNNTQASICMIRLPKLIKKHFENVSLSSVSIEIMSDPDDNRSLPEAYVIITTNLSVQIANQKLSLANSDLILMGSKSLKVSLVVNYT